MADERIVSATKLVDPTTTSQQAGVDAGGNLKVIEANSTDIESILLDIETAVQGTGAGAQQVQGTAADGASAAGNPVQVGGVDGSGNAQAIRTDTDGHLQVDILSGAGSDLPGTPAVVSTTAASVAAGGNSGTNLRTADLGGSTRYLSQVLLTASVPFKATIRSVVDGTATDTYGIAFGRAGETVLWKPPHREYTKKVFSANAGFDGYEVLMVNMDTSEAADLYSTFYHEG